MEIHSTIPVRTSHTTELQLTFVPVTKTSMEACGFSTRSQIVSQLEEKDQSGAGVNHPCNIADFSLLLLDISNTYNNLVGAGKNVIAMPFREENHPCFAVDIRITTSIQGNQKLE